jgi:hypothetical protein
MTTLSETLAALKKDGYIEDFNLAATHLSCSGKAIELFPSDFVVDHHFRFEGPSDPADESVVYAITSDKFNLKGTLVNGYGPSSDALADELVQALRVQPV